MRDRDRGRLQISRSGGIRVKVRGLGVEQPYYNRHIAVIITAIITAIITVIITVILTFAFTTVSDTASPILKHKPTVRVESQG